jgi:hypothetical protein
MDVIGENAVWSRLHRHGSFVHHSVVGAGTTSSVQLTAGLAAVRHCLGCRAGCALACVESRMKDLRLLRRLSAVLLCPRVVDAFLVFRRVTRCVDVVCVTARAVPWHPQLMPLAEFVASALCAVHRLHHECRVIHGKLDRSHILVDPRGRCVQFQDFVYARTLRASKSSKHRRVRETTKVLRVLRGMLNDHGTRAHPLQFLTVVLDFETIHRALCHRHD